MDLNKIQILGVNTSNTADNKKKPKSISIGQNGQVKSNPNLDSREKALAEKYKKINFVYIQHKKGQLNPGAFEKRVRRISSKYYETADRKILKEYLDMTQEILQWLFGIRCLLTLDKDKEAPFFKPLRYSMESEEARYPHLRTIEGWNPNSNSSYGTFQSSQIKNHLAIKFTYDELYNEMERFIKTMTDLNKHKTFIFGLSKITKFYVDHIEEQTSKVFEIDQIGYTPIKDRNASFGLIYNSLIDIADGIDEHLNGINTEIIPDQEKDEKSFTDISFVVRMQDFNKWLIPCIVQATELYNIIEEQYLSEEQDINCIDLWLKIKYFHEKLSAGEKILSGKSFIVGKDNKSDLEQNL